MVSGSSPTISCLRASEICALSPPLQSRRQVQTLSSLQFPTSFPDVHPVLLSVLVQLRRKTTNSVRHLQYQASTDSVMPTVVGLGDPIVDVLISLSHASFDQLGLERGGSTPLDSEAITQLLDQIPEDTPRDKYVLVYARWPPAKSHGCKYLACLQHPRWLSCKCNQRSSELGSSPAISQVHGYDRAR